MNKSARINHTGRPISGASPVRSRSVPLRGRITKHIATCCIARVLFLAAEDKRQPIIIEVNSPGGLAVETLPIISTLNGIKCPVAVYCRGEVGAASAVIAAHGLRGFRAAHPTTRFSFKSFASEGSGNTSNSKFVDAFAELLAQDTQKQAAEVLPWLREGLEFSAQEALRNGLIDLIAPEPVYPVVS